MGLAIGCIIMSLIVALGLLALVCPGIVMFHKMIISTIRSAKKDKSKPFPIVMVILFIICEIMFVLVAVLTIFLAVYLILSLIGIFDSLF